MDIVQEIISSLESEHRVMLATIIATSGSTPASAFSKMMVKEGGLVSVGTVGGGCMEGDVLAAAQRLHKSGKAEILTFHLTEDEYVQGLICGGTVHVLVEPMTKSDLPWLEVLADRRREGEDNVLATFITADGVIQKRALMVPNPSGWNPDDLETLRDIIGADPSQDLHKALNRNETRRITIARGELILEPIAGIPALIIFGGGHVSKHLSKAASMAGFRVTVIDDRE
ncbi:MAG TPA: XdhC family protein, partial [Bacteroidota bacterium]